MNRTLLAVDAEGLFKTIDVLPVGCLDEERGRRLLGVRLGSDYADNIDVVLGELDRQALLGIADYYGDVAAHTASTEPLGRCAVQTAITRPETVELAVTSRRLPDRLVRLMAIGLGSVVRKPVRGFGYVTERQCNADETRTTGFYPEEVSQHAAYLVCSKLVTLGSAWDLEHPGEDSLTAIADHRIVYGVPQGSPEQDASYCYKEQSRRGTRWVRVTRNSSKQTYGSFRHNGEVPANIIVDALNEPVRRGGVRV